MLLFLHLEMMKTTKVIEVHNLFNTTFVYIILVATSFCTYHVHPFVCCDDKSGYGQGLNAQKFKK